LDLARFILSLGRGGQPILVGPEEGRQRTKTKRKKKRELLQETCGLYSRVALLLRRKGEGFILRTWGTFLSSPKKGTRDPIAGRDKSGQD